MADVGNPNEQTQEQQTPTGPTAEQVKAARKAAIEKFEVESARSQVPQQQETIEDDGETIDLSGIDAETAKAIKRKLNLAERQSKHVNTLAQYGIEQAQKAKALELAAEFGLDKDEVSQVQKALASARTPDAVDLAGRELAIKLREDGSVQVATPAPQKKGDTDGNPPPVDQGRGGGSNRQAAFLEKVDEIDPYGDPVENQKKMDALKKDADAAQKRAMDRAGVR